MTTRTVHIAALTYLQELLAIQRCMQEAERYIKSKCVKLRLAIECVLYSLRFQDEADTNVATCS